MSQVVSMAPCVESASQSAPVPEFQGLFTSECLHLSTDSGFSNSLQAPTHPNNAVCSAPRFTGTNIAVASAGLAPHLLLGAKQKSPRPLLVQTTDVPQAHATRLAAVPSVLLQVGTALQRL